MEESQNPSDQYTVLISWNDTAKRFPIPTQGDPLSTFETWKLVYAKKSERIRKKYDNCCSWSYRTMELEVEVDMIEF